MRKKTIIDSIGNTPLVELTNIIPNKNIRILLKMEGNNPGGSVKDRAAFNMLNSAIERGDIKKGDEIIEPTSGNTGISLAFMANLLSLKMTLVMPENSTKERIQTMRAYGAKLILTPASGGIEGARDMAEELSKKNNIFMLNQFSNPDNWKAHYKTTGPEIWRDTEGKITHFVSAMGTTGTIMGVSTYLKGKNENIVIIGVEPKGDSKIPGIRKWAKEYSPEIFDRSRVDSVIEISEKESRKMTKKLAEKEGVFVGMSSGGAVASALEVARKIEKGLIVVIVSDRGDRYLSSGLFD
ncbi:MAG: cysteine synthase CysM [Flavobacteriaceae bacterium]|nr:cysteine synthase CysM [Flavobacteriaceae bacterium]